MGNQWIAKSLTIWGAIITILTAVVPAIGLMFPDVAKVMTPEWLATLSQSGQTIITGVGALIGVVLIVFDRLSGNTAKTLTLRPE
jgi:hypothetical protein